MKQMILQFFISYKGDFFMLMLYLFTQPILLIYVFIFGGNEYYMIKIVLKRAGQLLQLPRIMKNDFLTE